MERMQKKKKKKKKKKKRRGVPHPPILQVLSAPTSTNSFTLDYKSERPKQYKIAIIKNPICAKLISSSEIIFYSELKNIKQTFINNSFPNNIVDEQIKHAIKIINPNYNGNNTSSNKPK